MDSPRQPSPGQVIDGRYRVESLIARGGMATVFLARDLRLDRAVALKIMHPALAEDPEFVGRFVREARSAAQLAHPSIVAVYDQGTADGCVYLAMEYVEGRNLRDVLVESGALDVPVALGIMEQVLEALAAAHAAGIVHRDVKPENILVGADGTVKVADFGLARAIASSTRSAATAGLLIGTVAYLAPEQVQHGTADARTDVYAAGTVLFECLVGQTPYVGETPLSIAYQHVHADVPAPSSARAGVPAAVDELVRVATAHEPSSRYHDAADFASHIRAVRPILPTLVLSDTIVLDRAGHGSRTSTTVLGAAPVWPRPHLAEQASRPTDEDSRGSGAGPTRPPDRRVRRPWRHRRLIAALALAFVALAAGGGAWWWGTTQYTQVPLVIGLSPEAAAKKLATVGLGFEVDGQDFSEDVPRGMVTSTDPAPSGRARDDTSVHARVSKGPERHQVPDLRGMTTGEAAAAIEAATLRAGNSIQAYDDKIAADRIISTSPATGSSVKRDATVELVVSKGPAPVQVPKVTGLGIAKAKKKLANAGLKQTTTEVYSDTVESGVVISSAPAPGQGAHRGDTITLTVSKGPPPVPVPKVTGLSTADATAKLRAAGFRVSVRNQLPLVVIGRVYSQYPGGGSQAPRGSTITITIV